MKDENALLKVIFEKMEKETNKDLPFHAEDLKLDADEVDALVKNGVVLQDGRDLLMPEIFRRGLGFKYSTPGRVQVKKLKRMAQRKNR